MLIVQEYQIKDPSQLLAKRNEEVKQKLKENLKEELDEMWNEMVNEASSSVDIASPGIFPIGVLNYNSFTTKIHTIYQYLPCQQKSIFA